MVTTDKVTESPADPVFNGDKLLNFTPVSEEEVSIIIKQSASKSCSLDPMPTWLLKNNLGTLLPSLTSLINQSLSSGVMPDEYKIANVIPILKKPSLNQDNLKNYRPVSNLPFISKIIEKVVAHQLNNHLARNNIDEKFQSAYRKAHSTETAILKVHSDILLNLENKQCVLLVLLDLSAAFDTIDHNILLNRLENRFGIDGSALNWFKSYLSNRLQCVCIGEAKSGYKCLSCGVPQGSVLGPLLFVMYTHGLGDVIRKYGLSYHLYADDTQLYIAFSRNNSLALSSSISEIENCIGEIRSWMRSNYLKLNDEKTEAILVHSKYFSSLYQSTSIQVGDDTVHVSKSVRNLGSYFDNLLNMKQQIGETTKSAYFHLRRIRHIRKYLSRSSAETLIHAFITSKIDLNNALLYGLAYKHIKRLQMVHNSAARLITGTHKRAHITPILKELHWLPVTRRIVFKVCLLVFKCVNGLAPEYLSDCLKAYNGPSSLRSSGQGLFQVMKTTTNWGDRSFYVCGPRLWNSLPAGVREAKTVNGFKKRLKFYLFDSYFNTTACQQPQNFNFLFH